VRSCKKLSQAEALKKAGAIKAKSLPTELVSRDIFLYANFYSKLLTGTNVTSWMRWLRPPVLAICVIALDLLQSGLSRSLASRPWLPVACLIYSKNVLKDPPRT
jgi:hypothetical protein